MGGALSKVKVKKASGLGYGASEFPQIFSGRVIKVKKAVAKINNLVSEYMSVLKQVRERYPMGLGNYLMAKLDTSMQGTGALEVDKIAEKAGNYVFVNGHAVGLSSKLSDFETLAVRMSAYESILAKLTGKMAKLPTATAVKTMVEPPE